MDENFLCGTALFAGAKPEEVRAMLGCLGSKKRKYGKGETILPAGRATEYMGMVLVGAASIESCDVWGNLSIIGRAAPGEVFAETYACIPGEPMLVSVTAAEDCEVLFLNAGRLMRTCGNACVFHARLIENLLAISAQKNLALSRRIFNTAPKSIRGRLLSYLSFEAAKNRSMEFDIPFDRQQLADYLGVDRSALSAELGKMRREGLLEVKKNRFLLRADPEGQA